MTTYNGWTNYETWYVNLWLSNDEGLEGMAFECVGNYADEPANDMRYKVAEALEQMVQELAEMSCPGCIEGASFVSDLLRSALGKVDWCELADAWITNAEEQEG